MDVYLNEINHYKKLLVFFKGVIWQIGFEFAYIISMTFLLSISLALFIFSKEEQTISNNRNNYFNKNGRILLLFQIYFSKH